MNTEEIPLAITVVSQIKENGPWVGVIERHGVEVWRTWSAYKTPTAAYMKCWEHLNPEEVEHERRCDRYFEGQETLDGAAQDEIRSATYEQFRNIARGKE